MTLKYSNDEVTDEELRELNLQTATHQYIMQQNAQNETTPLPFQKPQVSPQEPMPTHDWYLPDGQNTQLSQVAPKAASPTTKWKSRDPTTNTLFAGIFWLELVPDQTGHI